MSLPIRWTRDRWFLLGLAFFLLNAWAVLRWSGASPAETPGPQIESTPQTLAMKPPLPKRLSPPPPKGPPPPPVEPLRLLSINQVEFQPGRSCTLRLTFNAAPRRAGLKDYITLERTSNGKALEFELLGQVQSKGILLRMRSGTTDQLKLKLRAGLVSADGALALSKNDVRGFMCVPKFTLHRVSPKIPAFGHGSVQLYFSSPVESQGIEDLITIHPPVDVVFEHVRGWRESGVAAQGPFEPGMVYTFTLDPSLASVQGKMLGRPVVRQVYMPEVPASIRLKGSGHYLSAAGRREVRVDTVNVSALDVTAESVHPNNLVQFAMRRTGRYRGHRWWYRNDEAHKYLGEKVGTQRVEWAAPPNKVHEVALSMDTLLGERRTGAFVLHLEPDQGYSQDHLVVLTDIGLTAKTTPKGMLVWANSIRTAQPLEGAAVKVYSESNQLLHAGRTDRDGMVRFDGVLATGQGAAPFLVTATSGEDLSYLPLENRVGLYGETRGHAWPEAGLEAYLYSDRGIYRPGEDIYVRALVRNRLLECPEPFPVQLKVRAPDGKVSRTLSGVLSAFGTVQFEWNWPEHVPTGRHRLEVLVPGSETPLGELTVAVEEFVPPRIAASITEGPARIRPEDGLRIEVEARYLAGNPAVGRKAEGRASFQAAPFAPDGYEDFVFHDEAKRFGRTVMPLGKQDTDPEGRAVFEGKLTKTWAPPAAVRALLFGLVRDIDGRTTAAHAERMIDVYPRYVGLRASTDGRHVEAGKAVPIDIAVVRPDGTPDQETESLEVKTCRVTWATVLKKSSNGDYSFHSEQRYDPVGKDTVPVKDGRGSHSFATETSGRYRITVTDPASGSSSSVTLAAVTPGVPWVDWSMEKPDRVGLELDRERYAPGEEALLVLHAPFAGRALVTMESDSILETRVIEVPAGRSEVKLNPTSDWLPNAYCTVSVVRPLLVGEQAAPHRAVGVIPVSVEEPKARLTVRLEAPEQVRPRETCTVQVHVEDDQGRPVASEVVVAAVDEGICRLTNFETPDPLTLFRGRRALASQFYDLYSSLMPEFEGAASGAASASGGGAAASLLKHHLNPVRARRFRPVALWSGPVQVDGSGHGTATFDLPEFTGRLRLMAVAAGRDAVGSAEGKVLVKRPVQAYTGLPRFLAPEDVSRMTLTLINGRDTGGAAEWSVQCTGPVSVQPARGTLELGAGSEETVSLELLAGAEAGVATLSLEVAAAGEVFSEETELAVRPPSAREVRGGVVALAPGSMEKLDLPSDWLDGTSEYGLTLAGMPELELGRSLDYLLRYPHGCLEQTTSSAFPLLYLADLAEATRPGSMTRADTERYIKEGILRLLSMQQPQGGFAYWPRTRGEYTWGSIYAMHFLAEAERLGHDVPGDRLDAAMRYLENLLKKTAPGPDESGFDTDRLRRAYACHVLAVAGRPHHGWMGRLAEETPNLDSAAVANVASALAVADRRADALEVLGSIDPSVDPTGAREASGCLRSPIRDLGLLLSAWVQVDPTDVRAAALARKLQELERSDQWRTTQEHAVALMALGKYAHETAGQRLPFEGEVTWAEGAISHQVSGVNAWQADSSTLPGGTVTAVNYGPGQGYLYWKAAGVPSRGLPSELDRRVRIRRSVLDEYGEALPEGPVEQGQLLVVKLTLDTMGQKMDQLVVEDLLPAGLEPENVAIKTSKLVLWLRAESQAPVRHREMRDDRTLVFPGAFTGTRSIYYFVRAVTPGSYIWPPASVSCMYDPSIYSVHGAGRLEVEE